MNNSRCKKINGLHLSTLYVLYNIHYTRLWLTQPFEKETAPEEHLCREKSLLAAVVIVSGAKEEVRWCYESTKTMDMRPLFISNLNNKGLLTLMKLENDFNPNHDLYLTLTKLCLYPNITTPKP